MYIHEPGQVGINMYMLDVHTLPYSPYLARVRTIFRRGGFTARQPLISSESHRPPRALARLLAASGTCGSSVHSQKKKKKWVLAHGLLLG